MTIPLARIERWAWYLFLITAPWQTRLIVWQADAVYSEWRSAAVYLSDVCMLALFVAAILTVRGRIRFRVDAKDWLLGLLFATAVLSLGYAEQLTVSLYGTLRLAQFIAFYLYVRMWAWGRFNPDASALAVVVGAVGQAVLGIGQYILQHDLGLRWIGETLLRTDMRGVAVFYDLAHHKILRAYGTLPHPNILAAYLMTSLWAAVWLWVKHGESVRRYAPVWPATSALLMVAMYLTFSRTVLAVWALTWLLLAIAIWWNRISDGWPNIREIRHRLRHVALTVVVVSAGVVLMLWPQMLARLTISSDDEAVRQRVLYNADALASGGPWGFEVNWLGVGIGNFTSWLAEFDRALPSFVTQPAHNIYLLAYSEVGLVGLLVFTAWIAAVMWTARNAFRDEPLVRYSLIALAAACVLIGALDHFFWTLQQGRLLWWTAFALAAGRYGR